MANRRKHMERSHRSYHNPKPFAHFEAKAQVKKYHETKRKSIFEMMKSFFHRTTNK